ncbi:hypothetical protein [Cytobacillus firmus]|uniref:hypothetical protein n=1 Tax=Cytobacillus firmus TaxID=1399 RepID=UPI0018CF6B7A|nr:hypothetical protein [Cytobacillus firmus]MBG9585535.1 hypothetical protein [Cytobacillus firmus]
MKTYYLVSITLLKGKRKIAETLYDFYSTDVENLKKDVACYLKVVYPSLSYEYEVLESRAC